MHGIGPPFCFHIIPTYTYIECVRTYIRRYAYIHIRTYVCMWYVCMYYVCKYVYVHTYVCRLSIVDNTPHVVCMSSVPT